MKRLTVSELRRAVAARRSGILVRRTNPAPFDDSGVLVASTQAGYSVICFDRWNPSDYMRKGEFSSADEAEVVRVFNACLTDWVDGIPNYRFGEGRPMRLTDTGLEPIMDDTEVVLLLDSVQKALSPDQRRRT